MPVAALVRREEVGARIPFEWIGQARLVIQAAERVHPAFEKMLTRHVAPLRPRPRFTPMPRHQKLRDLAARWPRFAARGRLHHHAEFSSESGLAITELRLAPERLFVPGWNASEPQLAILYYQLRVKPPAFSEHWEVVASVSLHALARRFERGPRDRLSVAKDIVSLALAALGTYPTGNEEPSDFEVPDHNGKWRGFIMPNGALVCRTWVEA